MDTNHAQHLRPYDVILEEEAIDSDVSDGGSSLSPPTLPPKRYNNLSSEQHQCKKQRQSEANSAQYTDNKRPNNNKRRVEKRKHLASHGRRMPTLDVTESSSICDVTLAGRQWAKSSQHSDVALCTDSVMTTLRRMGAAQVSDDVIYLTWQGVSHTRCAQVITRICR